MCLSELSLGAHVEKCCCYLFINFLFLLSSGRLWKSNIHNAPHVSWRSLRCLQQGFFFLSFFSKPAHVKCETMSQFIADTWLPLFSYRLLFSVKVPCGGDHVNAPCLVPLAVLMNPLRILHGAASEKPGVYFLAKLKFGYKWICGASAKPQHNWSELDRYGEFEMAGKWGNIVCDWDQMGLEVVLHRNLN